MCDSDTVLIIGQKLYRASRMKVVTKQYRDILLKANDGEYFKIEEFDGARWLKHISTDQVRDMLDEDPSLYAAEFGPLEEV